MGEFFESSPYLNLLLYPESVKFNRSKPLDPKLFHYLHGCVRKENEYQVTVFKKNNDGTIQIGSDTNDVDVTSEGLTIDGESLITKKANGELHIGKNSWITKEENGRQKVLSLIHI